nr:unnamed protein product [Callosobruchus chinensis]
MTLLCRLIPRTQLRNQVTTVSLSQRSARRSRIRLKIGRRVRGHQQHAGSIPSTSKLVNILDADYEEQVLKWHNEIDSDCSDIENEYVCIESDHNSESEQDVDELA